MQKQDVSEVMAPSTLGNKAEIRAITNITPIVPLNAGLNAIVGKRSSGAVEIGKAVFATCGYWPIIKIQR